MDLKLAGKRALITGGSKGIGLAVATSLGREGCVVTIVARNAEELDRAADVLRADGVEVETIACDLSQEAGIVALVEKCGPIDILVNNAGAVPPGSLHDIDMERWRAAWDLKVFGYITLTKNLYPILRTSRGVIVNVIGTAGETFIADFIAGSAGNAALVGFTRALGKASHRDGIRVVGINPGPVETERLALMMRTRAEKELGDAGRWQELMADMPFGRLAQPVEIADAVTVLASPRSGYTSGTILTINGGTA
jgi:NAD(P)-dependent dehydrogenase (short-subunit alcohol dehydrogenase family)